MESSLLEITPFLKWGSLGIALGLLPVWLFRYLRTRIRIRMKDVTRQHFDENYL